MEASKGTAVAGFPNLFRREGPNTGLGHTSMVFMLESFRRATRRFDPWAWTMGERRPRPRLAGLAAAAAG